MPGAHQEHGPIQDNELPADFQKGQEIQGVVFSEDYSEYARRERNGSVEILNTPDHGTIEDSRGEYIRLMEIDAWRAVSVGEEVTLLRGVVHGSSSESEQIDRIRENLREDREPHVLIYVNNGNICLEGINRPLPDIDLHRDSLLGGSYVEIGGYNHEDEETLKHQKHPYSSSNLAAVVSAFSGSKPPADVLFRIEQEDVPRGDLQLDELESDF